MPISIERQISRKHNVCHQQFSEAYAENTSKTFPRKVHPSQLNVCLINRERNKFLVNWHEHHPEHFRAFEYPCEVIE